MTSRSHFASTRAKLNSAISDHDQQRIEPDVSHLFSDPVTVELAQSMEQYLLPLTQQDWASRASINRCSQFCGYFTQRHCIWITGSIGESISVHCCTRGAIERIAKDLKRFPVERHEFFNIEVTKGIQSVQLFVAAFCSFFSFSESPSSVS